MPLRAGTGVQGTTTDGRVRLSEEHRAHLSAKLKERWASLTPEAQATQLARLRSHPRTGGSVPGPAVPSPVTDPPPGGSRSPLDDAPRAPQGRLARPDLGGRQHVAPPLFVVPDLPPIETGGDGIGGQAGAAEFDEFGAPPVALSQAQVATLVRFPFAFVALRRGPHWKLHNDETDMLAEPLTRKLNEHAVIARGLAAGGDWAVIGGGLALIVMTRLEEDSRHAKRADRGADDGPGPGVVSSRDDRPPRGVPDIGPPGRPGLGTINGFVFAAPQPPGAAPAPGDGSLPAPDPGHPDDAPV